jgi:YHS domain-containing protein
MLLRFILLSLFVTLIVRALLSVFRAAISGATPPPARRQSGPPDRGVQMVRDPVCGTFLPPASAVSLVERGGAIRYFCSEKCREKYKARV